MDCQHAAWLVRRSAAVRRQELRPPSRVGRAEQWNEAAWNDALSDSVGDVLVGGSRINMK